MSPIIEHINRFFAWWSKGLYKGLPDSLHKWVQPSQSKLILVVNPNDTVDAVWQQNGKQQERGQFSLQNEKDIELNDLVPRKFHNKKYLIELQLPKKQVLFLQKQFPESVKENLSQAIRYQIDRLTPFSSDNVYFDTAISQYNKKQKNIVADIFVTPRELTEKILAKLNVFGINHVDTISVANTDQTLNLTADGTPALNKQNKVSRKPLYFMLAVLALSLLLPVAYKERRIEQLDSAISDLRKGAAEQLAIRDSLFEAEEALQFLKKKRATSPMALDIVETLAKEIPKNTWLERLELHNNILEIRGESEKALSLIDLLEESSSFSNVRFNSPVALNKKNNRDKFHIQATVEIPNG